MQRFVFVLWSLALLLPMGPAHAARLALVIGNSDYVDSPLKNPVNDARAMDDKLGTLGFEVTRVENVKRRDIGRMLNSFVNRIKPGDEVVVFYAGHGLQVRGVNYLPAVDADIQSEEDVPLNSLNLGTLLERLDEAKVGIKILFLDACRNNPYVRSFRSSVRGLARVHDAPSGTLMHFATRPGGVAADGAGANGLYTTELLRHIDQPGLAVEQMLKRVAAAVERESKGQQEPWTEGSLKGDFYFKSGRDGAQPTHSGGAVPLAVAPPPVAVGSVNLDDLKKEEASRKEWFQWQARMRSEYDQVTAFNGSADLQLKAWERFLGVWGQNNPFSQDDEALRATAVSAVSSLKERTKLASVPIGSLAAPAVTGIRPDPLRGVTLYAPDVAENGAVVPVGINVGSGLRPGQVLELFVGDALAAHVQVQKGVMIEFQTRVILPHTGVVVSARQGGLVLASKQVQVGSPGTPFASAGFNGDPMRLRLSADVLRSLVAATSVADGTTRMTSDNLAVQVHNTGYIAKNPFYSFKADQPIRGEACLTVSAAGRSRTDCTR
jgi:hypothetical protein